MKINIESTTRIVTLNGIPCRVWEGESESGIKVICYVIRVAIPKDETRVADFENELKEERAPSPEVEQMPLKLSL